VKVKKMSKEENREREIGGASEEEVAVVLIGHGSKLPYNKEILEEMGMRIDTQGIFKTVRVAFMQLNSPSIEDTLRKLANEKIKNIVALPVFLAHGTHTTIDIPSRLKAAFSGEEARSDVKLIYAEPIGMDERIVDILIDRAKEALERVSLR
jgi:sirohydrochlorin cobaltochelatase